MAPRKTIRERELDEMDQSLQQMKRGQPGEAPVPRVIYMLRSETDGWVPPLDDGRAATEVLAYFTLADALKGARHQNRLYEIDCKPVKVKP